jgi:hypothetical protein
VQFPLCLASLLYIPLLPPKNTPERSEGRKNNKKVVMFAFTLLGVHYAQALDIGLGLQPLMGWGIWNLLGCYRYAVKYNWTEPDIRQIADAMVTTGVKDARYTYLNLDWLG